MEALELYAAVRQHSTAILYDADNGDSDAKAIETSWNMLVRFPEQCALGILEGAFVQWCKRNGIVIEQVATGVQRLLMDE